MITINSDCQKFSSIDISSLINFLLRHFDFSQNLKVDIRNDQGKESNGYAMENYIYINTHHTKTSRKLIDIIAHEFIHASQFEKGELGYDEKGGLTWHEESFEDGICAPWELDAIIKTINIEKELDKFVFAE